MFKNEMEKEDLLSLVVHNERFENYDSFNGREKTELIRETALAIDQFMRDFNKIEEMSLIKDWLKKLPDVRLIQTDIEQRLLALEDVKE